MFVIRKSTVSGVKRGLAEARRKRPHVSAVVRLLDSRPVFEKSYNHNTDARLESINYPSSFLSESNNNNNNNNNDDEHNDFVQHKNGKFMRKFDESSSSSALSTMLLREKFLQQRSFSIHGNSMSAKDVFRDASLRAVNDASIRMLRSALLMSGNNHNHIFATQSGGSRAYFSSGPVNKGGKYSTSVKVPTPKSTASTSSALSPFGPNFDPTALAKKAMELSWSLTKSLLGFLIRLPGNTIYYTMNSQARKDKIQEIKDIAKHEFDHYWTGTKLLMADVRTARSLTVKALSGSSLTRRERKQLLRTVTDLFRLVPFSMFILIPFMEFVLPFALKVFPGLLPSTFQDSLKAEEDMKRELKSRIAMAEFFQDTLEELAKEQKRIAEKRVAASPEDGGNLKLATKQEASAEAMLEFLDRARNGEMMPPEVIIPYAKYFQDDLTLDNMPRMQLINMCKYMSIPPYGNDSFLRFQLRHKIRNLQEDDQRILWEGIDSLTKMELREACQDRGMRSTGLSKEAYKRSLQEWLELSVHKNIPISLLIMSRTFFLHDEMATLPAGDDELKSVAGLADAISGLDKEVVNEVILEVATSEEKKSNPDVRKIKLEVLTHQNEKIKEEEAEREAAAAKKKEKSEHDSTADTVVTEAELIPNAAATEDEGTVATLKLKTKPHETSLGDGLESTAIETPDEPAPESKGAEEDKSDTELSADDFEAIEEMLTADPVSKERENLEKIKSAIHQEDEIGPEEQQSPLEDTFDDMNVVEAEVVGENIPEAPGKAKEPLPSIDDSADEYAAKKINEMEQTAKEEADKSTTFSTESELPSVETQPTETVSAEEVVVEDPQSFEPEEDPVVARLKRRIETMVDKIEVQLSDVQVKIGDKLHFLDKDMDGILSPEEVAEVLHQVLKRNISMEEALEIANQIDENKDGIFTVKELIRWIETNKLVKLESEGRDADMDRVIESHSTESSQTSNNGIQENNKSSKNTSD